MEKVRIQTTQNVFIEYKLAGIGDRIAAYFIDIFIIIGYIFLILIVGSFQFVTLPFAIIVAAFVPAMFYHLICELFFNGQSLGKRQLNIKVVKKDGTVPGISSYLLRWMLRPIDLWFYGVVAIVSIVVGGKGQRVGDIAGGTTVVKLSQQLKPNDSLPLKNVIAEQEYYEPRFPEVTALEDKDIEVLKETLNVFIATGNKTPLIMASLKVKKVLDVNPDMPEFQFLSTIIKDYNYLTSKIV
jgi:uncharacterized RDD family membrane protein YckC